LWRVMHGRMAGCWCLAAVSLARRGRRARTRGSLGGMPVFLGCSDVDFHIPLERVQETTVTLTALGAAVTKKIYPNMGHTIIPDEIDHALQIVRGVLG